MRLQQDPTNRELWVNPDFGDGPGTYGVVIGVSRYPHLEGGDAGQIAEKTYGLSQLAVSAMTAYDFFRWLGRDYRLRDVPIAKVWMLLAPTPAEVAARPEMSDVPTPTFDRCQQAIRAWFHEMKQVHPAHAERSRCVFFFSGHGLEVYRDHQILLPSDYLRPRQRMLNDAIATRNLRSGLGALAVPEQFFFLDACRNPPADLKGARLEGAAILDEHTSSRSSTELVSPVFYASASGAEAWQPDDPADGRSVFGNAIIEGLRAEVDMRPECDQAVCRIKVYPFMDFLARRVREVLRLPGHVRSPVRLGGESTNLCLTEVDPPPASRGPTPADRSARGAPVGYATAELPSPTLPPEGLRPQGMDEASLHDVLGSEYFSYMWKEVEALRLGASGQVPDSLTIHELFVDPEKALRVEISFEESGPHWLALPGPDGTTFATALPGDGPGQYPPRYLIEFTRGADYSIEGAEANLAPGNQGPLGEAAGYWDDYREMHMERATRRAREAFEYVLQRKLESPLAATVASLLLLRTRDYERLHDWLYNLAEWFPYLPDGPVLRAVQLLHQTDGEVVPPEALTQVLKLTERGLPYTGEALGYAAEQVYEMLHISATSHARRVVTTTNGGAQVESGDDGETVRRRLEALSTQVGEALEYFQEGGLFSMYVGPADKIRPDLILPLEADPG